MRLAIGEVIGSYKVVRRIASGGMGTVYEGRHLELDRPVAIKVISDRIAGDQEAERRFRREARAASRLSHPHICQVYDYHSADGLHFLVLEYLRGETLKQRLAKSLLTPDEALVLGSQVASAVHHAHRRGLIHRDLKPANIMLTRSGAKVLDFGAVRRDDLGRAEESTTESDTDSLTEQGYLLGTPAYMSPEQIEGEQVDARSDTYSLGVVLYEALVGRLPYSRESAAALLAGILHIPPVPIQSLKPDLDEKFAAAIERCLAKPPDDRWPTCEALATELDTIGDRGVAGSSSGGGRSVRRRAILTGVLVGALVALGISLFRGAMDADPAVTYDPHDIAVLYFDDLAEDDDVGHLAAGITESLIEHLHSVEGLSVISANGVKQFRGLNVSPDSVGRVLQVGSLVDGSVTRQGDSVRVFAQLTEVPSGRSLGARTIVSRWNDLIRLQDELATQVAVLLRRQLGADIRVREARASTRSSEAWLLVQRAEMMEERGRELMETGSWSAAEQPLLRADSLLQAASAADPSWPEPILRRGFLALEMASFAQMYEDAEAERWHAERADDLSTRAFRVDSTSAAAHELRGVVQWRVAAGAPADPDAPALRGRAIADLRRAIGLDEGRASAYVELSRMLRAVGRASEAAIYAEEALRRDRYLEDAYEIIYRLWVTYSFMGDFEAAERWCSEGRTRYPGSEAFVQCRLDDMARDPRSQPELDSAWALYHQAERLDSARVDPDRNLYNPVYRLALVAAVAARSGRIDSALALVRFIRRAIGDHSDFSNYFHREEAYVQLLAGRPDSAVSLLERYFDAFPIARETTLEAEMFAPLRGREDFERLRAPATEASGPV